MPRIKSREEQPARRFTLVMEETYILRSLDPMCTRHGRGFAGTAFSAFATMTGDPLVGDGGFLELGEHELPELDQLKHAGRMQEFLLADSSFYKMKQIPRFSVCCTPLSADTNGEQMVQLLGRILKGVGEIVTTIVPSHNLFAIEHIWIYIFLFA